jgi:hypothetical protein
MTKNNAYGVYYIFKSMEQGPAFRISMPKYPTKDPHYRIRRGAGSNSLEQRESAAFRQSRRKKFQRVHNPG